MAATKDSYAIISLGGKQYRVREGERLLVDRHVLGDKIRIGKRRPKSGYRKQTGFRASLSQIEIQSIGGTAKRTTAAATPAAEKETPAPKPKAETPAPRPAAAAPTAPAPASPPRGYEDFTVADISEKSKRWKVEQLEAALKFEKKNANRKGAIAALESALAAKQEKN